MSALLLSELSAIDAIADGVVTTTCTKRSCGAFNPNPNREHSIVQRRTTAKALSGRSSLRSQGFSLAPPLCHSCKKQKIIPGKKNDF